MKKTLLFTLGLFLTMVGVMSCGDSAADEARLKAVKDSLYNDSIMQVQAAADQARMDSMALIAAADSARAQALADSLLLAEEAAAKGKGGKPKPKPVVKPTPTPTPTPTPAPKPLTGKDAIKGVDAPKSGKDLIKEAAGTPKSGKDAIKAGGK
jgi:hypothetical protein